VFEQHDEQQHGSFRQGYGPVLVNTAISRHVPQVPGYGGGSGVSLSGQLPHMRHNVGSRQQQGGQHNNDGWHVPYTPHGFPVRFIVGPVGLPSRVFSQHVPGPGLHNFILGHFQRLYVA